MQLYQKRKSLIESWVRRRRAPWSVGQVARALNVDRQIVDYHMKRLSDQPQTPPRVRRVGGKWELVPKSERNVP